MVSIKDDDLLSSPYPKVMVSDGTDLGVVAAMPGGGGVNCGGEDFVAKFFRAHGGESVMSCAQELPLRLARKCVESYGVAADVAEAVAGEAAADEINAVDADGEVVIAARQLEFGNDDEAVSVQAGKDFALMLNSHGKLLYSGRDFSSTTRQ